MCPGGSDMKKRLISLALALVLALSLTGCALDRPRDSDKLQVVCTLFPYYDFVRQIGGDHVDVTLLIAAGREVHSFEPTPLDAIRLSEADVFIYNGGESEEWVEDLLDAAGENIGTVLTMMDHADVLAEEVQEGMQVRHGGEEDEDEIEYDEHIWTSPVIAMELCRVIGEALMEADPAHAGDYQARLDEYLAQLEALDQDFRQVVDGAKRTTLVFGDRFPLLYFCRTYGLDYRAAFHGCSGDTEPSLATLKYLIDKVNAEDIPVVYTIELSSQKIADAIAETTGAKVLTFQSCQTVSRADFDGGATYLSLMRRNVEALKEGLQ
ncbi:MAG: zinc ABC transporter substrate-binding protein [Oscillospiraceae bacterium]|nr:zinc ABC transporter substrate-binding protein [Oscillospiraceae bacterium]MBQ2062399.1 zinc ABC transporter substrate-binding protein [Oscillospiraceae bacterium]